MGKGWSHQSASTCRRQQPTAPAAAPATVLSPAWCTARQTAAQVRAALQAASAWAEKRRPLCNLLLLLLLPAGATVTCSGAPAGGNATWGASCSGRASGSTCAGTCAAGTTGSPTATCGTDGRWAVSGSCLPGAVVGGGVRMRMLAGALHIQHPPHLCCWCAVAAVTCSGLPSGGNATWSAACSGRAAGANCTGTCATGTTGSPTASCGADGRWTVVSGCMPGAELGMLACAAGLLVRPRRYIMPMCTVCTVLPCTQVHASAVPAM